MYDMIEDYVDSEIITEVLSATNHRLIQMLMEKWITCINQAEQNLLKNNLEQFKKNISHCIKITGYLKSCLNQDDDKAKHLSAILSDLYFFIERQLNEALHTQNMTAIKRSTYVFNNIKYGWDNMVIKP